MSTNRHQRINPFASYSLIAKMRKNAGQIVVCVILFSALATLPLASTGWEFSSQEQSPNSGSGAESNSVSTSSVAASSVIDSSNVSGNATTSEPRLADVTAGDSAEEIKSIGGANAAARAAEVMVDRIMELLTLGPPFEAKIRQRVWAAGREVVEVGRYEQAGRGTGWFRMELQVPIADGKGRWQQSCDGRLAWTREELADEIRYRRVDVGRLDELLPPNYAPPILPRLRVGGLAEIMDRLAADYWLVLSEGHIEGVPMLVLKGSMRDELLASLRTGPQAAISDMVPQQVRIAIPTARIETPLPARIEFWSQPGGRLISLLEIYDMTTIEPPPVERFRFDFQFEPGGTDPVIETDLYVQRFGLGK